MARCWLCRRTMTEYNAECPMCWKFENKTATDKQTAERRAKFHERDTGHRAEVVQVDE